MKYAIEINNLTKCYGKNRGVQDITLKVEEGDVFGFLGPNGAGKSTTIRCLLGMLHFGGGSAQVLGYQVGREQKEILKNIGYMPSEVSFHPSMRVGEVIRFAAQVRGMDCEARAKYLCENLEIDIRKRIGELSLGNRKKVSIVCAMQHNPKLLILDEPTSGLDPLMQENFWRLLAEAGKEGTTCFLSSHVLPEVKKYCRHAGIIKEGKLVGVDTVENLTKSDLRKVRVFGVEEVPALTGIFGVTRKEQEIAFSYTGRMAELLSAFQGMPVQDMLIAEPSLEEIFMHFYEEEGFGNDVVETGV